MPFVRAERTYTTEATLEPQNNVVTSIVLVPVPGSADNIGPHLWGSPIGSAVVQGGGKVGFQTLVPNA